MNETSALEIGVSAGELVCASEILRFSGWSSCPWIFGRRDDTDCVLDRVYWLEASFFSIQLYLQLYVVFMIKAFFFEKVRDSEVFQKARQV